MRRSRSSVLALALALAACGGSSSAPPRSAALGCPAGPVTLADAETVAALAGCKAIQSLAIKTGAALDLGALAQLESVAGDLVVGPSFGLEELPLPALRRVGGTLQITSNANLRGVYLRSLEQAAAIEIAGNVGLSTVSMGKLQSVTGSLAIVGNADIEMLDVSSLVAVGGELAIADNPQLVLVEADALASAKSARIENNRTLAEDVTNVLRSKAAPTAPEANIAP